MRRTRLPDPPVNGRFGYPLGFVAATTVTIVTVAAHTTTHPLWSVAALAVTTAAVAAVTTLPAAIAIAAVSWALHAGFVLGRHGDLQFSAGSAGAAALLVGVAVIAYAAGVVVRVSRHAVAIPHPRGPVMRSYPVPSTSVPNFGNGTRCGNVCVWTLLTCSCTLCGSASCTPCPATAPAPRPTCA